jgi:hypothetical protein
MNHILAQMKQQHKWEESASSSEKTQSGRFYTLQDFRKTEKLQHTMTVILRQVVFRRCSQEAKTRKFLVLASETNKSEWALICQKN